MIRLLQMLAIFLIVVGGLLAMNLGINRAFTQSQHRQERIIQMLQKCDIPGAKKAAHR